MNDYLKENEVLNDLLGYDGLKIIQEPGRFNFSLDSTLLANFVTLKKGVETILDLCTGNAPIPLMMSLRTKAKIYGIDIQPDSVDQAIRSVSINGLNDRINIYELDLKNTNNLFQEHFFDVVTCNPPYFKVTEHSNINARDALTIARHEVHATLDDVVKQSAKMLKPLGRFAMVHRPDRLVEIIECFKKHQIEPKRLRFVYPRLSKEANGLLIEGVYQGKPGGLRLEAPVIVYEGDTTNYTQEILTMFHLERRNDL